VLGFGLRLQALSFQPLWGDEGWSFYFAAQPLPQLLQLTAVDIHPPLYYVLLKGWLWLIGFGPEAARFFSVVVGTLLIPVISVLGQRLLNKRVGVAAAALVAVMPMAIYYSQEVRMYGLVTLLGALATYLFISEPNSPSIPLTSRWSTVGSYRVALYVMALTTALYTMYYAAFIFLFQLLHRLIQAVLKIQRFEAKQTVVRFIWSELRPFFIVGLLYLPWVIYAGWSTTRYVINKRQVEDYLPLSFMRFWGDHLVAFSVGHVSPELRPYVWVSLLFVLLAAVGFIATVSAERKTYTYLCLYLFIPLLAGYVINLLFPFTPLFFERTWLVAAPAYWLFIAAGLATMWNWSRVLTGVAAVVMLLITAVSLAGFYTIPRYPHEDYRPLLRDIAARATAADTLLASYQWQLGFYYAYLSAPQPHFFTVPGWGQGWAGTAGAPRRLKDLTDILQTSPRLWFPAHQALGHFWEDEAEITIAQLGYPVMQQWYSPQTKLILAGSSQGPLQAAPAANFENHLNLLETKMGEGQYEAGRGIVPVQLTWQKTKSLGSQHRVSLRLADAAGRTWAIRDSYPQAGQAFFTDLAPGQTLTDRHGLLIAAGTPPGPYRLLLSVRRSDDAHPLDVLDVQGQPQGAELLLGEVQVIDPNPPVGPTALPVQFLTAAIFGQAVRLVGYSLGNGPFKAGEMLPLNLFWESLAKAPGNLTTLIQLQDTNAQIVHSLERAPLRSTTEWHSHTLLRDPYDFPLPPTLPPGHYQLVAALLTPNKSKLPVEASDQVALTWITTIDRPHNFDPPTPQFRLDVNFNNQARLVGLDLATTTVKAGGSLALTLYWQAQSQLDRSWKVFVHLVNHENKLISQQDQIPGAGQFPTTGWLPQEYLVDPYSLTIPADTRPGAQAYRLEIGLYDANDFTRLPIIEDGRELDHRFVLEKWPISVE
jgi:hypothetical protein